MDARHVESWLGKGSELRRAERASAWRPKSTGGVFRPLLSHLLFGSLWVAGHTPGSESGEPVAPGGESEPEFELTEASGVSAAAVAPEPAREPWAGAVHHPPEKAVELLSKISLFSALQPSYCGESQPRHRGGLPSGAVIFKEGAQGDKMYLILSGAVRIGRQVPGMGEEALAILRAGTHFGEMALIDDFPRSADARAHEACRLFVVRKEDMEDLLFVDRDWPTISSGRSSERSRRACARRTTR